MPGINENVDNVLKKIGLAARKVGRDPENITLVCVTKMVDAARMNEAIGCGIADIGEARLQEAKLKFGKVSKPVKWHMVGHLQTNKARDAVKIFDLIHSVDSLRLARELDKRAAQLGKSMEILIEVNTSGEPSKFGVRHDDEVFGLVQEVAKLNNVKIRGLMTMAPPVDDPELARPCFKELKRLCQEISSRDYANVRMDYLSMGMTQDYEVAIEEGANMVRIGTAIFGSR